MCWSKKSIYLVANIVVLQSEDKALCWAYTCMCVTSSGRANQSMGILWNAERMLPHWLQDSMYYMSNLMRCLIEQLSHLHPAFYSRTSLVDWSLCWKDWDRQSIDNDWGIDTLLYSLQINNPPPFKNLWLFLLYMVIKCISSSSDMKSWLYAFVE